MANPSSTLLVTGASGHLGRRVVELLLASEAARGRTLVATTRTPERLADLAARGVVVRSASFEEPATLPAAFAGVDRALLISTDAVDRPGRRIAQHRAAVNAARAAGVRHVVYTSLTNPDPSSHVTIAPDHWATEQALVESGLDYTVLRNNLYTDYLVPVATYAVASGRIANSYGDGAVGYVTREDCARAAAAALASASVGRSILDISGPAAVTQAELAAILSEVAGRPVAYRAIDPIASVQGLVASGLPQPLAELLVSFERAGRAGQLAVATSAVRDLTGTAPTSVREFLEQQRAALRA